MRKPIKWTLLGLGLFVLVAFVVSVTFFISSAVVSVAIGESSKTIAEQFKKQIPKAISETEIRQIVKEEIDKTLTVKEKETTEETPKAEEKETTTTQLESSKLEPGQEFIYNGVKIALTKYEIKPTNINKNELWAYLYVENINNVPHEHIHSEEFVIYDKGRKDGILFGAPGLEEGRKLYDTGSYDKLNPGEICEGWVRHYIEPDWKAEDIEIHFVPSLSGIEECIWKLK